MSEFDFNTMLTDLYQVTMAYGYWKSGTLDKEAIFNLSFRNNPFNGGFAVACGLESVLNFIDNWGFRECDLAYLASLRGDDGGPLFEAGFLDYLRELRFSGDIDAVPEGTLVFPYEPLVRVQGSLLQCQLLETYLLNALNFQTLIATKAARVCLAAGDDPVIEFGARRAQGPDGALAASRAAYIGGCGATSNLLAGEVYGIPVKGTHAHSWVMSFPDEITAFQAYAAAMPNNVVFLVDTYDTLQGVRNAAEVGLGLRELGKNLAGIRLDSGDLAWLSIEARKILDAAGLPEVKIMASNDLDETIIGSLKAQGAKIDAWGVGTRLVTGGDQAALGGVYKLAAIRENSGAWQPVIKLSEQSVKISNPGAQQVRRYFRGNQPIGDCIHDRAANLAAGCTFIHPFDETKRTHLGPEVSFRDLLIPIYRDGVRIYDMPAIHQTRASAREELSAMRSDLKRFINPHTYKVGLEQSLYETKKAMILRIREGLEASSTAL